MGFKKNITMAVSATIIAVAGVGMVAGPASAAPANCGSGAGCVYGDVGFKGGFKGFQQYITDYADYNWSGVTRNMDNDTSSLYNNGNSERVYFYKDRNKGGASFSLGVKEYDSNLHDASGVPANFQDTIGSSYFKSFN